MIGGGAVKSEAASITVTVLITTTIMISLCPAPFFYDSLSILPEEWVEARVSLPLLNIKLISDLDYP